MVGGCAAGQCHETRRAGSISEIPVKGGFVMRKILLFVAVVVLHLGYTASAQSSMLTVDEMGNGSFIDDNNNRTNFKGALGPDPSGGLLGNVLVYTLPVNPTKNGDVVLREPNTSSDSDILRFVGNKLVFYSDNDDMNTDKDIADTGTPQEQMGAIVKTETGNEGTPQGATYTPGMGDPGFVQGITYQFVSEVPEPAPIALVSTSLLLIAVAHWLRGRCQVE